MTNKTQETIDAIQQGREGECGVEVVEKSGEVTLYQDADGIEYISDGGDTYSEFADGFTEVKKQYFTTVK